jgi:hypothetical protein
MNRKAGDPVPTDQGGGGGGAYHIACLAMSNPFSSVERALEAGGALIQRKS